MSFFPWIRKSIFTESDLYLKVCTSQYRYQYGFSYFSTTSCLQKHFNDHSIHFLLFEKGSYKKKNNNKRLIHPRSHHRINYQSSFSTSNAISISSSSSSSSWSSPSTSNQLKYESKHSKRKEFANKSIEIDPKTMKYLDTLGIGIQKDLKSFQRGKKGNTKLKKLLKEGKLDISNLQRISLLHQHPKFLSRKHKEKQSKTLSPQIPALNPKNIQYLKSGRFLQFKRAIRKEKRRIAKEAINFNRANLVHKPNKINSLLSNQSSLNALPPRETVLRSSETFIPKFTKLLASCDTINEIPFANLLRPEIAIIGRSNVGKSTLLNSLLAKPSSFTSSNNVNHNLEKSTLNSHKSVLACVSSRPGQTTSLNFYRVDGIIHNTNSNAVGGKLFNKKKGLTLIDMPGYGFAFAKDERKEAWYKLILEYLVTRGNTLKRVLLLIDARHGLKQSDYLFLQDMNCLNKLLNEKRKSYSSLISKNKDFQNASNVNSFLEELEDFSLSSYNKSGLEENMKSKTMISEVDESPMKTYATEIFERLTNAQNQNETLHQLSHHNDTFFDNNTQGNKILLPPIQLVLTKCDLVLREDLARLVKLIRTDDAISHLLGNNLPVLMVASTGRNVHLGIDALKESLGTILKK